MMRRRTRPDAAARDAGFRARQPLADGIAVAKIDDLGPIMALIGRGAKEGKLVQRSAGEVSADIKLGGAFVHRTKGSISGITFLSVYSDALAEIRSFYVHEGFRNAGTGTGLITKALKTAKNLGIKEVLAITRQDNEKWFARFGFGKRSGFQTALFRKMGASQGRLDEHVENATMQDVGSLHSLMNGGEHAGELIPRSTAEILQDMREGNAFVYRQHAGDGIIGMGFLAVYSRRLAEVRNLYAIVENAESALVGAVAARADELKINETMVISKNGNGSAFAEHGFLQELHGFRVALFRDMTNPL